MIQNPHHSFLLWGSCLIAALLGYLGAKNTNSSGAIISTVSSSVADESINESTAQDDSNRPWIRHYKKRDRKQLDAAKAELWQSYEKSGAAGLDWPLRHQTAAFLKTMSTEELESYAREIQVSETESFSVTNLGLEPKFLLIQSILKEWGQRDPAAAMLAFPHGAWGMGVDVFRDWLRRDPSAARAWASEMKFTSGNQQFATSVQKVVVEHLASGDLSAASDALGKLSIKQQEQILLTWSSNLAMDAAKRGDLIKHITARNDPEFTLKCYEKIVKTLSEKSMQSSAEFIDQSGLPDEQKEKLDHQALGVWAQKEPEKALTHWLERKEAAAPEPLLGAFYDWSLNSPGAEEAIRWVQKLEPSPVRQQFEEKLVVDFSYHDRFKQAAEVASGIAAPEVRLRNLKLVKRQWLEQRPKSASEWFQKLPPEDQAILNQK